MAGFLPDTTPPGSAPMPLGKPAPAPIGTPTAPRAPSAPTGPKAPRGGGGHRMLSAKAKKAVAIKMKGR